VNVLKPNLPLYGHVCGNGVGGRNLRKITLMEDYRKKHKIKPLKSVPQETLQSIWWR